MHGQERRRRLDPQHAVPRSSLRVSQQSPNDRVASGDTREAAAGLLRFNDSPGLVGDALAPLSIKPPDDFDPMVQHRPYERSYDRL